jgi:hypothetical protein
MTILDLYAILDLTFVAFNRAFYRFGQAKFLWGGFVLGSSQFSLMPQLPQKITLNFKVPKMDSKIIISLFESKFVTHTLYIPGIFPIFSGKSECDWRGTFLNEEIPKMVISLWNFQRKFLEFFHVVKILF